MNEIVPDGFAYWRPHFELAAAEYFGRPLEVIQASRMSNGSYDEPKLAAAWYFWRRPGV